MVVNGSPRIRTISIVFILILSFSISAMSAATPLTEHVVLVMVDGFDIDYLDGRAELPTLSKLIAEGAAALPAQTILPSVTNPSWSSLISGGTQAKTGNLAYNLNSRGISSGMNRYYLTQNIVEALADQGKLSASVGMFLFKGRGLVEGTFPGNTAVYVEPEGDIAVRLRMATDLVNGSAGYSPHLLAVYIPVIDGLGHDFGPNDPKITEALKTLDAEIGQMVSNLPPNSTVIVVADHGMTEVRYANRNALVQGLLRRGYLAEWVGIDKKASDLAEIAITGPGRIASFKFLERYKEKRPFTKEEKEEVMAIVRAVRGVAQVLDREQLDEIGVHPGQADFMAEAAEPYAFWASSPAGTRGTHGSSLERQVPLILWGSGIKPGIDLKNAQTIDVAPTIAALLGVNGPKNAEGQILREAMQTND